MTKEVVIVGGARTPMSEYVGTPGFGKLKGISAIDLGVHASKAALERSKVAAHAIERRSWRRRSERRNDSLCTTSSWAGLGGGMRNPSLGVEFRRASSPQSARETWAFFAHARGATLGCEFSRATQKPVLHSPTGRAGAFVERRDQRSDVGRAELRRGRFELPAEFGDAFVLRE